MFLLGFSRKWAALALCKSIETAMEWFEICHTNTFATIQNSAVYLLVGRVSIFTTLARELKRLILASLALQTYFLPF